MHNFLRFLLGLLLLPACWGVTWTFIDGLLEATNEVSFSAEPLALLGGIVAFVFCWLLLPPFVRTYVLGHELTHALWGLLFGARPSRLRVSASGGSVNLSKSNFLITLAPYFFPFYTFVVALVALIVYLFVRPLPWLPVWMFLIGFTWAFHIVFTVETLTHRQPDVTTYGRLFSWSFIYLVNVFLVLVWLAATTPLTFARMGHLLVLCVGSAYLLTYSFLAAGIRSLFQLFTSQ